MKHGDNKSVLGNTHQELYHHISFLNSIVSHYYKISQKYVLYNYLSSRYLIFVVVEACDLCKTARYQYKDETLETRSSLKILKIKNHLENEDQKKRNNVQNKMNSTILIHLKRAISLNGPPIPHPTSKTYSYRMILKVSLC